MNNELYILQVLEDFKNGYASITDIIQALNIDLLDCDYEDLLQYVVDNYGGFYFYKEGDTGIYEDNSKLN